MTYVKIYNIENFSSLETDLPDLFLLDKEISESEISSAIFDGVTYLESESEWRVFFLSDLSSEDDIRLNSIISNHTGIYPLADSVITQGISSNTSPTNVDDGYAGYTIGSIWVDTSTNKPYVLVNNNVGTAVWKEVGETIDSRYQYSEYENEQSTSGSGWYTVLDFTTDTLPSGDYHITWSLEIKTSSANKVPYFSIYVDDVAINESTASFGDSNSWFPHSSFKKITFSNNSHNVKIKINASDSGNYTTSIRRVRVATWRVL